MKLGQMTKDELQKIVNESTSVSSVLSKISYSKCKTAYSTFYKTCANLGVTYSHFSLGLHNRKGKKSPLLNKDIFLSRLTINSEKPKKQHLLQFGILENRCYGNKCSITDVWLDSPIILHLDHINGVSNDNRIENLRFLCPNCHSQTSTYSGRNNPKQIQLCVDCGSQISRRSTRCQKCSAIKVNSKRMKFQISKKRLEILLKNHSYVEIGKMFGVSDVSIKKRAKKLGLIV